MPLKYLLTIITSLFVSTFFITPAWMPVQAQGVWTELHPGNESASDGQWEVTAISDTRQVILMGRNYGEGTGLFHFSTDAGASWERRGPTGYILINVAMSATGQVILAGESDYMGDLFISTDTGTTWQKIDSLSGRWNSVAMSNDGEIMLAGSPYHLYRSINGGVDWSEIYPTGDPDDEDWWGLAISGDGQTMLATQGNLDGGGGQVYLSKDSGNSWEPAYSSEETPVAGGRTAAISEDGEVMIVGQCVAENFNRTVMSRDGGTTWEPVTDGSFCWLVSLSDTGERGLIAQNYYNNGEYDLRLLYTEDFGETWHDADVELPSGLFNSVATSGDGNSFLVAGDDDYLWQFTYPPPSSSGTGGPANQSRSSRPRPPACHDTKPPSQPDLFQIDVNDTQASLYFAPTPGADRFYISYGDGETVDQYGVEVVSGESTGVIGFTINHLQPGQRYTFTVRSGNGCMPGDWSNRMTITTRRTAYGGASYYKNFVARILAHFPMPIDYVQPTDQVLGAATTQTVTLQCFTEPVQVDPPLYTYIPDPYGIKSILPLLKLLRPKCSLVFPY